MNDAVATHSGQWPTNMIEMHDVPTATGELLYREPLAKYTSWRVGGPADQYYRPVDRNDLLLFLRDISANEPLFLLGLGSNLLVRDGGIRGTIIHTRGCIKQLNSIDRQTVNVEAGVPCARVARFCGEQGLVGAEFLAGIPGTIGGALAMNAGAFGGEIWDLVESVSTFDRSGHVRVRNGSEFEIGYRSINGPGHEWFLSVLLKLSQGDSNESQKKIRLLLAKRSETQPINVPSCGSVFRNPPGAFAARLIEASGLMGFCIGGACVSEKHANFIINTGGASAWDIERVILHIIEEVERLHGIRLETEVRIVGERLTDENR